MSEIKWFPDSVEMDKDFTEVRLTPINRAVASTIARMMRDFLEDHGFKAIEQEMWEGWEKGYSSMMVDLVNMRWWPSRWETGCPPVRPSQIPPFLEEKKHVLGARRLGLLD
jgi:hypothetical protein